MKRKIVCIVSPYGGMQENYEWAKIYAQEIADEGSIPVASHLMLHDFLDDRDPGARAAGLALEKMLIAGCDEVAVFLPTSGKVTAGMQEAISYAWSMEKPIDFRRKKPSKPAAHIMKVFDEIIEQFGFIPKAGKKE